MKLPPYTYKVVKATVTDGDSVITTIDRGGRWFRKDVDFGFHDRIMGRKFLSVKRIRLAGIDAPEQGVEAKNALTGLLALPVENRIYVSTKLDRVDKYGRVLGTFFVLGSNTTINKIMVDLGFAQPYNGGPR